jgi:hypothetical protein
MADLYQPLLERVRADWIGNGWSLDTLADFRMEDDGDDGDDDDDEKPKGTAPTLTPDDITRMQSALKKANKEAETARLRLKEIEDAGKSDTEKLTGRVSELEQGLSAAQTAAQRFEVAIDKGVPKSLAVRLQGGTREEMEKDADELLKTLGGNPRPPSFDGGTKDKPHQGEDMNALLSRGARR